MRVSLVVRTSPLRATLRSLNTPNDRPFSGPLEPIAPFLEALARLGDCEIVCSGPEPLRQYVLPQVVKECADLPHVLLRYVDLSEMDETVVPEEMELECEQIINRVAEASPEQLAAALQDVKLGVEAAICEPGTKIEGDVVVRARGLPWQASDSHVAQFFAGLDIAPGGIALCLSAEGRRNGEALVRFTNQKMRDLALKRHRHFLLSRYIEVYRATPEEFLQVAAGLRANTSPSSSSAPSSFPTNSIVVSHKHNSHSMNSRGSSSEAVNFVSVGAAMIVRMRGLPYDCTEQQIREFFAREPHSCEIMDQVLFVTRSDSRPTGDAFVQFADEESGQRALNKHRHTIGNRYIELFRSTSAEVQQVVKRSTEPSTPSGTRRDCIRLRGLPYEAQVQQVLAFLGEHARNIQLQGVHMVFNSQGNPSGECFIQMNGEPAALAAATSCHNKFMVIGKKQRYIEVFQCSPDDMNLVMAPTSAPTVAPPPLLLPQRPFLPGMPPMMPPMNAPVFWPYPSPPVSPNMMLPGQLSQYVVYGLGPNVGVGELVAQFQNESVVVENVLFTRMASASMPGEALITLRPRSPSDPPIVPLDPQYLAKLPIEQAQFVPATMPMGMPPQPIYTVIQS